MHLGRGGAGGRGEEGRGRGRGEEGREGKRGGAGEGQSGGGGRGGEERRRGGEEEVSGAYHIGKGRMLVYISVAQELLQGLPDSPAELHCHRTDRNPTGVHHSTGQDSRTLTPNTVASTQEAAVM